MVSTPGIGVDSVTITYALLGPFMTRARVAGALASAVSTGLLVATTDKAETRQHASACGCTRDCSSSPDQSAVSATAPLPALAERLRSGIAYAFGDLLSDISAWTVAGLVPAGVLLALVPPQTMASYGSGLFPMLLMAIIGIPLYICATAATPISVGLLMAGISPGTVLVFLLAGPITSLATLGMLRRELGNRALAFYLAGIIFTSIMAGLLTDRVVTWTGLDVRAQAGTVRELTPESLEWVALLALILLAIRSPLRRLGATLASKNRPT